MERGLLQGSLLSPMLFNVFIDDLAESLLDQADEHRVNCLLYADDIKLIPKDSNDAQRLLDVVTNWCDRNGMEVSIRKCGVISRSPADLQLAGQKVPYVQTYKYLGFVHGHSGILWSQHMSDCVGKATALLNTCRSRGDFWPVWVKLTIFRAFIRSVTEYGAPLFFAWTNASRDRRRLWEVLETLYRAAMQWICPMASHWRIASAVLGIVTPQKRFEGLSANFTKHLEKMPPDHLARSTLAEWLTKMPWPSTVLLPRMNRTPLAAELQSRCAAHATTWRTEVKRWYGECLAAQSTLGKIISRRCRISPCGSDSVILIDDPYLQKMALAWRCNSFACRRQCIGGHRFIRSCVNKCLQPRFPEEIPEIIPILGFPDHFCYLDLLLNLRDYQTFGTVATWILNLVARPNRGSMGQEGEEEQEEEQE
jgi:hypothetical protein